MNNNSLLLRIGTRSSKLAIVQTEAAVSKLSHLLPAVSFEVLSMSSPGDEDRTTDLERSDPDFFTRYLDGAIEKGELDCAIHSAKDLADNLPATLQWFWLPWHEDPRDVIVFRENEDINSLPQNPKIGISSTRRRVYCQKRFPNGSLLGVRGNIEERLHQLDNGEYDLLIMAGAALKRLSLEHRITEWIPLADLRTPEGQGYLAITYRKVDQRLHRIRSLFLKTAVFIGGGAGDPNYCTLAGWNELQNCDICIFDALSPEGLLKKLPSHIRLVDAGKRQGKYKIPREKLDRLIVDLVRQGKKVARLKGGDPGIYGRLAEEIRIMENHHLPYRVIPGVSSLNVATTGTGMLLTRRGISKGFTVITPQLSENKNEGVGRQVREGLALVFFMAVGKTGEITTQLLKEGRPGSEPASMIFGAGSLNQIIISGCLSDITNKVKGFPTRLPGIFVVGNIADLSYLYKKHYNALDGKRVLITCSEVLQQEAEIEILNLGGIPIKFPLIRLDPTSGAKEALRDIKIYDWVVLTSPSAVYCLISTLKELEMDLRSIPSIIVPGPGVSRELHKHGLKAEVEPGKEYGAKTMLQAAEQVIKPNQRILRLRSHLASRIVEQTLSQYGANVTDCVLYKNSSIQYDKLPRFDLIFFGSGSAVRVFLDNWGETSLTKKISVAIGKPTADTMTSYHCPPTIISHESTTRDSIKSLATYLVNEHLKQPIKTHIPLNP